MIAEPPVLVGSRQPRICVVPDGDEHPRWGEVLELLDKLEIVLDGWQLDVLHASMLRRGEFWAAFTVAVCAPRQNGKNEILQARELVGALLLGEPLIIHSAHLADTCMEAFMRLDDLIDANDWLLQQVHAVRRTNGREAVYFNNGSRIRFRTRTRGGGRGFSGSPVIFDEPMFFPVISQNAILPVMSAQPDPQAWYTGSAVDQMEHEDGVVFARVRERALAGGDDRIAYFEWSLDAESPESVTAEVAADPSVWSTTNPALGIRITPEYIKAERMELSDRGFAVERLGVGDWPDTDPQSDASIDLSNWPLLVRDDVVLLDPVCVAYDVSPERSSSVVLAGRADTGDLMVQVVRSHAGTGWLQECLEGLYVSRSVQEVVCDGFGPSAAIANRLDDAGITIKRLDGGDYGKACGLFVDEVGEKTVVHLGQHELDNAIRGARARPLIDRWAWSRVRSSVDISPLVAATLALWSAAENDVGEVTIF